MNPDYIALRTMLDKRTCAAIRNAAAFDGITTDQWAENAIRAFLKRKQPVRGT